MKLPHTPILCSLASLILGASSLQGAVFLIDLNTAATNTAYPGGSDSWNIYAAPANVTGAIKDTTGSTLAGYALALTKSVASAGIGDADFQTNAATGGPSWAGSPTEQAAIDDHFITAVGDGGVGRLDDMIFTFSNLSPGLSISLDAYFSRGDGGDGYYEYSLDGGTNWLGFNVLKYNGTPETDAGWDVNTTQSQLFTGNVDGALRYMNSGNLTLTGSTLVVRVSDTIVSTGLSGWAGMSAMRLTVVPEPVSGGLLGLGLLGWCVRRRRA